MRQRRKIAPRIKASDVRKNVPYYLKNFILKKFRQIDSASWPRNLKGKVKKLVFVAACSEDAARKYAQPRKPLPHGALVESYANTLFKEFNRFVASKNVAEFIAKRELPLPRMGLQLYGTKKEILKKILDMLDSTPGIPEDKKRDVLDYLGKNKQKLTNVQLHRVQHYVVGLAISAS